MKFLTWLDENFEEAVCFFTLALVVVLLALQVFLRFFLQIGYAWNEELERFAFIWFAYLSTSLGVKRMGHIRVIFLVERIPDGLARKAVVALSDLLWLVFNIFVVVLGWQVIQVMLRFPQHSPAMGINMALVYSVVPLAFLMMSLRLVQIYVRGIRKWMASRRAAGG